ncbi:hypothetical protein Ae168Ps1_3331c [Pseudonocardia sp. Ae168_Ps1]|nr:hypothetical protein Ae168Ps1_3331c [Pseudonocardia sp. Ae168_Ps1]
MREHSGTDRDRTGNRPARRWPGVDRARPRGGR